MKTRKMMYSVAGMICLTFVVAGCGGGGGNTDLNPSITATDGKYFVYGKVIDTSTLQPVSNATVRLFTGSVEQSSVTKGDIDADQNLAVSTESGDFLIADVVGGDHRLRVEVDGYAVYEEWISINQSSDNVFYFAAGVEGKIKLDRSCDIEAYVTFEGSPVGGVTVHATNIDAPTSPEISAITDENGKATLAGLSQTDVYSITAPAFDTNSDGAYDYTTKAGYYNSCVNSDRTAALALDKADRNDPIYVIGGSYDKYFTYCSLYYGYGDKMCSVKDSESIVIVFSYPISIDGESLRLTYERDLVPSTDSQFGEQVNVDAAVSLSGGGTVLTITPAEKLFPNEFYSIVGSATAVINGKVQYYTDFGNSWYVIASGLSVETITADNCNDATEQATFGKVYLEFPEYVSGTFIIKSYVEDGVFTAPVQYNKSLNYGEFGTDEGGDCCTNGICGGDHISYRVELPFSLADNQQSSENSVTVFVDAISAEGTRVSKELTLAVE